MKGKEKNKKKKKRKPAPAIMLKLFLSLHLFVYHFFLLFFCLVFPHLTHGIFNSFRWCIQNDTVEDTGNQTSTWQGKNPAQVTPDNHSPID